MLFQGQGARKIGKFLSAIWNDDWERETDDDLWQLIAATEVKRKFQEHYDYCASKLEIVANQGLQWCYTTTRGTRILLCQSNRLIWDAEKEEHYVPPLYWEVEIPPEREGGYHHELAQKLLLEGEE